MGAPECAELEITPLVYHTLRVYSLHISLIYHLQVYVSKRKRVIREIKNLRSFYRFYTLQLSLFCVYRLVVNSVEFTVNALIRR